MMVVVCFKTQSYYLFTIPTSFSFKILTDRAKKMLSRLLSESPPGTTPRIVTPTFFLEGRGGYIIAQ